MMISCRFRYVDNKIKSNVVFQADTGMSDLTLMSVKLAPNGTNRDFFRSDVSSTFWLGEPKSNDI